MLAAASRPPPMAAPSNPVGIIFPPADLRGIIDKTAQFVAKNGREFENRVMQEQSSQRFTFLFPNNPYRAYYDMKLSEFQMGREEMSKPAVPQAIVDMKKKEEEKRHRKEQLKALTAYGENVEEIKPPPKDEYYVPQPYIAAVDVDVIKMTALFVARNGQRFLAGLTQRERDNPQFDFLQASHSLFSYFTMLVDAFTKCLMPPQSQLDKQREIVRSHLKPLEWCYARCRWLQEEERKVKEKEDKVQQERAAMQAIDWHDFVVVETVEFTKDDETLPLAAPRDFNASPGLPEPLDVANSKQTIVAQAKKLSNLIQDVGDMEMDDEGDAGAEAAAEEDDGPAAEKRQTGSAAATREDDEKRGGALSEEGTGSADAAAADGDDDEQPPEPPRPADDGRAPPRDDAAAEADDDEEDEEEREQPRVVRDYVRQPKRRAPEAGQRMQRCPITGQLVPAENMTKHLRILLLDPKWKEQKNKLLEKAKKESAFAPLEDVDSNLATFVAKRPDLFGSVDEQITEHGDPEEVARRKFDPKEGEPFPPPNPNIPDPGLMAGPHLQQKRARVDGGGEEELLRNHPDPIQLTMNIVDRNGAIQQQLQLKALLRLTVAEFKASLVKSGFRPGLRPDKIALFANGWKGGNEELSDDKKLAHFGVSPGATLKMTIRD